MPDTERLSLDHGVAGRDKKKVAPQDDLRLRTIARYELDPKISPKELEEFLDRKEREKTVRMCYKKDFGCRLRLDASWAEINAYHKEIAERAWAKENGVDPDLGKEEIDAQVSEKGRLRAAAEAGLPSDTSWDSITVHLLHLEDERRARGTQSNDGAVED